MTTTIIRNLSILTASILWLYACGTAVEVSVDEEDVVDIIATTVSQADGGLAAEVDHLLELLSFTCGYSNTETETISGNGASRSFELNFTSTSEVVCVSPFEVDYVAFRITSEKVADLVRLDINSRADSEWYLKEIPEDGFALEGSFEYHGEEQFKSRSSMMVNSNISYRSDDLVITDQGDLISGEISLSFDIETSEDGKREGEGTLTITDTNLVLVDIDSFDHLYTVSLETGETEQSGR